MNRSMGLLGPAPSPHTGLTGHGGGGGSGFGDPGGDLGVVLGNQTTDFVTQGLRGGGGGGSGADDPHLRRPLYDPACQAESFPYVDLTQQSAVRNTFVSLYILVVVLSVTGNLMVIWTVWRKKHMRTVTNYYIVNLAVSDLLVALFVVPLKLLEYTAPCSWGIFSNDTLCSALSFVLPVFVFSSVLTLVAISVERYYAIVHPLSSIKIHCKSRTCRIIALTWVVAIIMAGPYVFYKSYPFVIYSRLGSLSRQICTDRFDEIDQAIYRSSDPAVVSGRFRKGFFLFLFVTIYLTPLVTILTTSVRIALCLLQPIAVPAPEEHRHRLTRKREESKRKVALMMIVVAVGFVIAWTPFYVITFVSQVQQRSFLRESNYLFTMLLIHWLGFLNSCVNPVIYNFMNDKFHRSFRQLLTLCRPRWALWSRSQSTRWTRVSLTPRRQHVPPPHHHHHHHHHHFAARGGGNCVFVKSSSSAAAVVGAVGAGAASPGQTGGACVPVTFELRELHKGTAATTNGTLEHPAHRLNYCRECSSSPVPESSRSSDTPEPSRILFRPRY